MKISELNLYPVVWYRKVSKKWEYQIRLNYCKTILCDKIHGRFYENVGSETFNKNSGMVLDMVKDLHNIYPPFLVAEGDDRGVKSFWNRLP